MEKGWRRHEPDAPGTGRELLLVVDVAGRRFALRASDVVEIHRMVWVSPLPEAPGVVTGIIDVRGVVVPVLDLGVRLGVTARPPHPDDRLVVVVSAGRPLALHVEHALDAISAAVADPADLTSNTPTYAAGLVRLQDGLVVVHDVDAFLAADELTALDDALAARETV